MLSNVVAELKYLRYILLYNIKYLICFSLFLMLIIIYPIICPEKGPEYQSGRK